MDDQIYSLVTKKWTKVGNYNLNLKAHSPEYRLWLPFGFNKYKFILNRFNL